MKKRGWRVLVPTFGRLNYELAERFRLLYLPFFFWTFVPFLILSAMGVYKLTFWLFVGYLGAVIVLIESIVWVGTKIREQHRVEGGPRAGIRRAERSIEDDRLHAHLRDERWAEAIPILRERVQQDPKNHQHWSQLAEAEEGRRSFSRARACYQRAAIEARRSGIAEDSWYVDRLREATERCRTAARDPRARVDTERADREVALDVVDAASWTPPSHRDPVERVVTADGDEDAIDLAAAPDDEVRPAWERPMSGRVLGPMSLDPPSSDEG